MLVGNVNGNLEGSYVISIIFFTRQELTNEIRTVYEQYNLIGGLKSAIIEEKAVNLLRDNAVIKEKS